MRDLQGLLIAVDFDGTCVTHAYPSIGRDIGAAPVLKNLEERGARLILWTQRYGRHLKDAVKWFKNNKIPLYGINENPNDWSESPKAYAHRYIDDAAVGAPLLRGNPGERPYIDWSVIKDTFREGLIL